MKLYEINQEMKNLLDSIQDWEEITVEQLNQLKELKLNEKDKLENIGKYIREIEDDVDNLNKELERLNERKKRLSNKVKWLKDYVKIYMENKWIKKMDTDLFTFSFRSSKAVEIIDEAKIPKNYFIVKEVISLDKKTIWDLLKKGEEIEWVRLDERQNLQIK